MLLCLKLIYYENIGKIVIFPDNISAKLKLLDYIENGNWDHFFSFKFSLLHMSFWRTLHDHNFTWPKGPVLIHYREHYKSLSKSSRRKIYNNVNWNL